MAAFFPGLAKARRYTIEVIQESGETIFVPSGWHHTVENTKPTLSINHNWLNGTNVHWSWEKLQAEIDALHSSESGGNNSERVNTDAGASDTSQVGDDLLLLWLVLSKKACSILADERQQDDMAIFNLQAILPILEGIQKVIHDGKDQGLEKRCECNIAELILDVKARLKP
jgi:JmjC domain, hydroxylase